MTDNFNISYQLDFEAERALKAAVAVPNALRVCTCIVQFATALKYCI